MTTITYRDGQGRLVEIPSMPATRVKGEFGSVLDRAVSCGAVAITRHDKPRAVLLSIAEFQSLTAGNGSTLDALEAQFDDLLAGMQTREAKKGMAAAFDATPAALGRSAVKAAALGRSAVKSAAPDRAAMKTAARKR